DPYYVTPLVMGASMFLLSWIGMRQMPPNPQAKMMSYMMPVMFTVMFLNFASGLNLYYAVQNIAALPQQWLISRERAKAGVAASGIALEKLPTLDALLLTHAHADHLSFDSLERLPRKIPLFAPPVVAKWLRRLGFDHAVDLEPTQTAHIKDLTIHAAAATHRG